ncbi:hypothetical protein QBC32DRAFT_185565, partial [Pseudoneurospora amorphoporcata]
PMSQGVKAHHYDSSMAGAPLPMSNMFLALTMGALLRLGLKPYTVEVPILPIWKGEHLLLGERLVTLFASSLITQGGFNGVQAGSKTGQDNEEAWIYVAGKTTYLKDNLDRTVADMDRFLADVEGVDNLHETVQFITSG